MKATHANKIIQNKAFTYYIKDFDALRGLYTLENPMTKDVKTISKCEFDKLYGGHGHKPAENRRWSA